MFPINILVSIPLPGKKRIFLADNLPIEECSKLWVFISQSVYL